MKLYLAGPYAMRDELKAIADDLHATTKLRVTSRWLNVEDNVGNYIEQGQGPEEACRTVALIDLEDVDAADAIAIVTYPRDGSAPPGGGRFVEYGYGYAKGKQLYVIGGNENVFVFLPGVMRFEKMEDFTHYIKSELRPGYPVAILSTQSNKLSFEGIKV